MDNDKGSSMNLGGLAANVVSLADRKIKPTSVKAMQTGASEPRDKNYSIVPWRAIKDDRINKTAAMIVLMAFCGYTNRRGETFVGHQTIADVLKVSRQAISKQVKRLVELGYLEVVAGHSRTGSARVRVIFDPALSYQDVNANIPARLQPDIPPAQILSKEESAERLKAAKQRLKRQPQKLPDDDEIRQPQELHLNDDITQPQRLPNDPVLGNLEALIRQPGEGKSATSRGCHKGNKVYKEGQSKEGKSKEEGNASSTPDASTTERRPTTTTDDQPPATVIAAWGISLPLARVWQQRTGLALEDLARMGEVMAWEAIGRAV